MNKPAVTLSILALLAGAGVWWLQGHGPARETARPSAEATPVAHEDQPVALTTFDRTKTAEDLLGKVVSLVHGKH